MKILITTSSFGKYDETPLKELQSEGYEIVMNHFGHTLSKEEALTLYTPDIDGVVAGTEGISREIISRAENLKVISRCGIGLDNVDMAAAKSRNIKIFNTPVPVVDAVAELAVGLILCSLRGIAAADSNVRRNIWKKPMGVILKGKTLGIIGLGNIGRKLVELLSGFSLAILAYDKQKDKDFAEKFGVTYTDLDSLLSKSDIISVHLPLTKNTKNLLTFEKLSIMNPAAFLINTSRASIIDEEGLVKALEQKKIAGAALDVFEKEPYSGPLTKLDNVVLTPHIGSYAKEARIRMEIEAAKNLITGLTEKGAIK